MSADLQDLLERNAIRPRGAPDLAAIHAGVRRLRAVRSAGAVVAAIALLAGPSLLARSTPTVLPIVGEQGTVLVEEPAEPPVDTQPQPDPILDRSGRDDSGADRPGALDGVAPMPSPDQTAETTGETTGDPPEGEMPTATAPPRTDERWRFDDGFDGWDDAGPYNEVGFYSLGNDVSTRPEEPRPGWRHTPAGHAGTGGLAALVMAGSPGVALRGPTVRLPHDPSGLTVSLWFRWDGPGDDALHVIAVGPTRYQEVAVVGRDSVTQGMWHHLEVPISDFEGQREIQIRIAGVYGTQFGETGCEATAGSACDLGLTIDDIRLRSW